MKIKTILLPLAISLITPCTYAKNKAVQPANNIEYPIGLSNWRVIGTSIRNDNNTQRVILGNTIAIRAARSNMAKTNWPQGAILAKFVWKNESLATWPAATVPGKFVHAEIMVRDTKKYAATGGWGFARWKGEDLQPHGTDSRAADACFSCHQAAKETDFVFTRPAKLP